jgi:hypothetical protein
MSSKRHRVDDRQITWTWIDPEQVLRDEAERGDVVFEAPEASKIVAARPPPLPRIRQRRNRINGTYHDEPPSYGLPFGARREDGGGAEEARLTCWSCGQSIAESAVLTAGHGVQVCPGCGARLPFV